MKKGEQRRGEGGQTRSQPIFALPDRPFSLTPMAVLYCIVLQSGVLYRFCKKSPSTHFRLGVRLGKNPLRELQLIKCDEHFDNSP